MTSEQYRKHPKGLYLLFFTELWERFGFYTIQTILILYMTKSLNLPDHQANLLYAAFSSLLYLTPTIGGFIADKYLGFQRTIQIGGFLLVIAYLLCALPNTFFFFLGLGLLICANGLFKPNVSSIVGELYEPHDPRRDSGFTLFYMGINLGALIPPIIAGSLIAKFGWHSGFVLAAAGMALGQIIFLFGKKQLGNAGRYPQTSTSQTLSYKFYSIFFIGLITTVGLCQLALRYPSMTNYFVEVGAIAVLGIVFYFLLKEPLEQRKKMIACLILIVISVAFWALYSQSFTSIMLFADRNMDKHFLGIPFDAEATQFFNPFYIIVLSPILSRLWIRMDTVGLNPSTQMKFLLGIFFMSAGFLLLAWAGKFFAANGYISAGWMCSSYLLQTVGELLISPIGLAMITVLCPKHLVGMMMGVWFFTDAAAFAIGGSLANMAAVPESVPATTSLAIYSHAFELYGCMAMVVALVSFTFIPFINRLINSETYQVLPASQS